MRSTCRKESKTSQYRKVDHIMKLLVSFAVFLFVAVHSAEAKQTRNSRRLKGSKGSKGSKGGDVDVECRISIDQFFAKDGKVVFGKTGSKTEVGIRTFYFPGKTPPNRLVRAAGQTIGCNVDGGGKINAVEKSLQKCAETCLAKGGTFPCGTLLNQLDSFATADVEDGIIYNFYLSKGVNLRILSDITIDTLICSESLADYSD